MPEEQISKHRERMIRHMTTLAVEAKASVAVGVIFLILGVILGVATHAAAGPKAVHSYGMVCLVGVILMIVCYFELQGHRAGAEGQMHVGDAVTRQNKLLTDLRNQQAETNTRVLALEEAMTRLTKTLADIANAPRDELATRRNGHRSARDSFPS